MDDTCWGFLEDAEVMKAVDMAVNKALRKFPNASREDCQQEAMVYAASHGSTIQGHREKFVEPDEFLRVLSSTIYSNGLRYALVKQSNMSNRQVPWPEEE